MAKRKLRPTKELIKQGLFTGLLYATLIALFYYFDEDERFSIYKFLFNLFFFGGFMAFVNRFDYGITKEGK